jgi:capsular polysaccharide biosynthesis protein
MMLDFVPREPGLTPALRDLAAQGLVELVTPLTAAVRCHRRPVVFSTAISSEAYHGANFTNPAFMSYEAESLNLYALDDAVVCGSDALVQHQGGMIRDFVRFLSYWEAGSAVEAYVDHDCLRLRAEMKVTSVAEREPHFLGFTASWRNYAHWMQECLPRLYVYLRLIWRNPKLKLLLPPLAPESFQAQTLALLGIDAGSVVTVAHGAATRVHRLLTTDNINIWSVPPICIEAAEFLAGKVTPRVGGPSRVYIHREVAQRRLTNFDAISDVLAEADFVVVSFETMRLEAQIAAMRGARMVIGEHGAGLANLLFCQPPCTVIELFNPVCVQPAFWSVASARGSDFGFLAGEHVATPERASADWNTPYTIDPAQLRQAIEHVGAAVSPVIPANATAKPCDSGIEDVPEPVGIWVAPCDVASDVAGTNDLTKVARSEPPQAAAVLDIFCATGGNSDGFVGQGWAAAEPHGRWTDGPQAELQLPGLRPGRLYEVTMLLAPFLAPPQLVTQFLSISANGVPVFECQIVGEKMITFVLPSLGLKRSGWVRLHLHMQDASSPRALGLSEDRRCLGFSVRHVTVAVTGDDADFPLRGPTVAR